MAQLLDARNWTLLYSQITSGLVGTQALLNGTPVSNPIYGTGLIRLTNTGNAGADATTDNFYSTLTFIVDNTEFSNESISLANFNAVDSSGNSTLLGYMGSNTSPYTDANINISGFSNTDTQYHTLLLNTNAPNGTGVVTINFLDLIGNAIPSLIMTISINDTPSPAGENYIVNLPQGLTPSTVWSKINIAVSRANNFSTNIVGILKTTTQLTPGNLVCFAENSMVFTPSGEVPIQNLKQGDVVYDEHFNHQTVEFVAKRTVFPSKSINKYSVPIEIKQGQLDNNVPVRDTIVSSAHLIKYNGKMVPASELGLPIEMETVITYYNVSVSNYSTMIVNGLVSETLDTSNDQKVYEKTF